MVFSIFDGFENALPEWAEEVSKRTVSAMSHGFA
jgi:hypothetical protein